LYLPTHFKEERIEVLHALMRARPLATLVTLDASGLNANHIPVETVAGEGAFGVLRGHVARANPVWKDFHANTQALAIFQGPQTYISPTFYPSKRQTGQEVPTWDYAVVHARGSLRFIQDASWLRAFVTRLSDAHEAARKEPWKVTDAPPAYIDRMLGLIVGFEFSITALTGKWKINQNHPAANKRGVVAGLRESSQQDALEIADLVAALDDAPRG
jgi:transcriptional regulator